MWISDFLSKILKLFWLDFSKSHLKAVLLRPYLFLGQKVRYPHLNPSRLIYCWVYKWQSKSRNESEFRSWLPSLNTRECFRHWVHIAYRLDLPIVRGGVIVKYYIWCNLQRAPGWKTNCGCTISDEICGLLPRRIIIELIPWLPALFTSEI